MKKRFILITLLVFTLLSCQVGGSHTHTKGDLLNDEEKHWYSCSGCDELLETQIHTFDNWTIKAEATCTEKGLQERVCSVCNYRETQEINALGHTAGAEATCGNDQLCTKCNEILTPKSEHTYASEWSKNETHHWKATTCGHDAKGDENLHTYEAKLEKGITIYTCICGYSYIDTTVGDDPYGSDIYE